MEKDKERSDQVGKVDSIPSKVKHTNPNMDNAHQMEATGVMTRQGRSRQRSIVEANVQAALQDLRSHAQQCQSELEGSAVSREVVVEHSRLHLELLAGSVALIEEKKSLVEENELVDCDHLVEEIRQESAEFSTFLRNFLVDQSDVESHHSFRSNGSARSSASSQRRAEARVELAKKRAEMSNANKMTELELERISLNARIDQAKRENDLAALEAELQVRDQIEAEELRPQLPKVSNSKMSYPVNVAPLNKAERGQSSCTQTLVHQSKLNPVAEVFQPHPRVEQSDASMIVDMMRRQAAFSHRIEPFSGNPVEFRHFWKRVEDIIERNLPDQRTRLHRLLEVVEGDPRLLIDGCVFHPDERCYSEAKRLLSRRYGDDLLITNKFTEELRDWPSIVDNCEKSLGDFYSALLRCSSVVNRTELDSPRFLGDLLAKLSFRARNTWRGIAMKRRREPGGRETFQDFLDLVEDLLDRARDPVYGEEAIKAKVHRVSERQGTRSNQRISHSSAPKLNSTHRVSTFTVTADNEEKVDRNTCLACPKAHDTDSCEIFKSRSLEERIELTRMEGACFGCLRRGHISRKCQSRKTCTHCQWKHPTSLHKEDNELFTPKVTTHAVGVGSSVIAMSVVRVRVSHGSKVGKFMEGLALLDPLSSGTFASSSLIQALGVCGPKTRIAINTLNGERLEETEVISGLRVQQTNGEGEVLLGPTFSKNHIPLQEKEIATPNLISKFGAFNTLYQDISSLDMNLPVVLLIGADNPLALRPLEVRVGDETDPWSPYAIRTVLGWSVMGPMTAGDAKGIEKKVSCHRTVALPNRVVNREVIRDLGVAEMLASLGSLDFVTPKFSTALLDMMTSDSISNNDVEFMNIVNKGTRFVDGFYEVPLPIKERPLIMAESRDFAKKMMITIIKRFDKEHRMKEDYFAFMADLLANDYAREINSTKLEKTIISRSHYIPHHPVYHPKKRSIRVVFNCANRVGGQSINDSLLTGPDLTNQLVGVLLRFRLEPVAFTADIRKMFYQVRVPEDDMDYLRFWWFKSNDESQGLAEFEMTRHLFGGRSSPGCANYALRRTAVDHGHEFSTDAREAVTNNFYVDDCLKSVASVEKAVVLANEVTALCKCGGFELTKFLSNSREFLSQMPNEVRSPSLKTVHLDEAELPTERALGVLWHIEDDTLGFHVEVKQGVSTKRSILAMVSSIYDPIGAAAAFILPGRILMQEACAAKIGWDEKVPPDLDKKWKDWLGTLSNLTNVRIPRSVKPPGYGGVVSRELHSFGDGSVTAYGAVVYLRLEDDRGQINVSLVAAKARVAPSHATTIPRMELVGSLLAASIAHQVKSELHWEELTCYHWTDSMVVMGYINNDEKRFHLFVANRVRKIRDLTHPTNWRHVKSAQNPADDASRGLSCRDANANSRWFRGPDFLWNKQATWREPETNPFQINEDDPELKREKVVRLVATNEPDFLHSMIDRYSSWERLKKAVSVWIHFVEYVRSKAIPDTALEVDALLKAERFLVKNEQDRGFGADLKTLENTEIDGRRNKQRVLARVKSPLAKLDPLKNESGLLRVGGRLNRLSNEEVNPVVLPKSSKLTQLIIRTFHRQVGHGGRGVTMNAIRQGGWWIVSLNSAVRSFVSQCLQCRILRGQVEQPKMSDLPVDRMQNAPPFTFVGVDYFGPFVIKNKRKEEKRYGVIFSCLSSRSVHIEIAHSMDTSSYIGALRRLIARRGPIRLLRSDNGLNFVGGDRELNEALNEMDQKKIAAFLNERGADYQGWKRNPPSASNFGGVWERQIRSVRSILEALMMEYGHILNDETFVTLMCEVEAIINSRPLTVDTLSDSDSPMPLSPSMLLTQKTRVILPPPGEFSKSRCVLPSQYTWRRTQFLADQFWSRFRREYLDSLQPRSKWNKTSLNLTVGDVVMLREDNMMRNSWKLARVSETFLSDDGVVRSVKIRIGDRDSKNLKSFRTSELYRPTNKLVLLERARTGGIPDEGATQDRVIQDKPKPPPDFGGSQI